MDEAVPGEDIPVPKEIKLGSQKHSHGCMVLLNRMITSMSQHG